MAGDPLLKENWEHAAEEQGAETRESRGVELYYTFFEKAQKYPELLPLVKDLERAIGTYADAVLRWREAKMGTDVKMTEAADKHRKAIHDALIDSINPISRWYAKQKIDNNWRRDIIGLDREAAGEWALDIARDVLGKILP